MSLDQIFRVFVGSAAILVVASTGAGCGGNVVVGGSGGSQGTTSATGTPTSTFNKCEQAAEDIVAKVESCGSTVVTGTTPGPATCSEKDGLLSQCLAACFVAAPCACVVFDGVNNCTPEEQNNYVDCINSCK